MSPKKTTKTPAEKQSGWMANWGKMAVPADELEAPPVVLPTGALALDLGLRIGGMPMGCIARLYGKYGSGKTTLCQLMCGNALREGYGVLWLDAETRFEATIARANGLDIRDPNFHLFRLVRDAEQRMDYETAVVMIEEFVRDTALNPKGVMIIIDSLDGLRTKAQLASIDSEKIGDRNMAAQAWMNAQWFPAFNALLRARNSTVIAIQQMRANIGNTYEPIKPGGGYALEHYASVEIKLTPAESIKKSGAVAEGENDKIGRTIIFDIKKNSFAQNMVRGSYPFRQDCGIDYWGGLIELGLKAGLVEKRGAFIRLKDGTLLGQGFEASRAYLMNHPDVCAMLESNIRGEKAESLIDEAAEDDEAADNSFVTDPAPPIENPE